MAYEYWATINQSDKRTLQVIIQPILPSLPIELLSISNEEVRLRWKDLPRQLEWPEDVIVFKNARGIFISFHFGSDVLRQLMLNCLIKSINDNVGAEIKFVEL